MVEDDKELCDFLKDYLAREGFEVEAVHTGEEALQRFREEGLDLVILDLVLPGMDGLEVCRRIRAFSEVPIIILTAKGEEADRVAGLELGADDYVVKPFSPRELLARIKAVLRRVRPPCEEGERLSFSDLTLDMGRREVVVRGRAVELTRKEFDLLWFLARYPGRVFTREQILAHAWGEAYPESDERTVDQHVRRIRKKLREAGARSRIETVWGVGYRFRPGGEGEG